MSRMVQLPLERVKTCYVCGSNDNLKICKQCAERTYCSVACQTKDWKEGHHKQSCTKYDHLDLELVYPFFAGIVLACIHLRPLQHPCGTYIIVNSPNPRTPASDIPGTTERAVIVKFGGPIAQKEVVGPKWWPTGRSPQVRNKLFRRMMYEGNVLALNFVIAFSILAVIYRGRDVRLKYRSSPIADFGIVKGEVRPIDDNRLAYQLPDGSILLGQDPEDHYWLYFTTARGEELILDFCLYTFNCSLSVNTDAYFDTPPENEMGAAPAYFQNRAYRKHQQKLGPDSVFHRERRRFSVLRDKSLLAPVEDGESPLLEQKDVFFAFMEKVSGRSVNGYEKILVGMWLVHATSTIETTMHKKLWKTWPKMPVVGTEESLE